MGAIDKLPPDQRAVLQMVLQRGHSYDQIAGLLSIDREAVRQRALDGFDALTPIAILPGPERALVTDYLLGQLPDRVAEEVHGYLQTSDADREWATAVAAEVAPLSPRPLPEVPVGAPLGADDWLVGGLEPPSDSPADVSELPRASHWELPLENEEEPPGAVPSRPSSRRGGTILLGSVAVLIVAGILVAVLSAAGSSPKKATSTTASTTTPQILAQLNLTSPSGAGKTVGVADVIRENGVPGIVIDAQGLPANTAHNAYAVWLYNSPSSHSFAGFVKNLVTKNGRLAAQGRLPAGASRYHHLLITLETQQKPTSPGEVVLSGPFREHS
ncbi:MAG TPA: anti-sigma factor [Solirubrobacteraceae bacterium]|nr:anti-sigma factor [Solirubrobacteraceae bacterium]